MTLSQNSPGKDLKGRYLWVGGAMLLGLALLAGRLYRLQITQGEEYAAKSVSNFVKPVPLPANRGMLLDRRGQILVDNRPSFDVFITPAFCQKCADETLPRLGAYLNWDGSELKRVTQLIRQKARSTDKYQRVPVHVDLTRDQLDVLLAHHMEFSGLNIEDIPHRSYRAGPVLAHLLGYMNEITQDELEERNLSGGQYNLGDYVGRRGIERSFENMLRGTDGSRKEVVDARGKRIPELNSLAGEDVVEPVPGKNLVLSIDYKLQEAAEKAFPGAAGAVIAVDVRTGFILALVSRPSFDPNQLTGRVSPQQMFQLSKDPLQPMIFRATQNHFSPGSTFKVVTALAALESGQFKATSTASCNGGYSLGSRRWRCHKDSGHGIVDLKKALQVSCDVWFYKVADTIGINPIGKAGKELGLGSPTGIGVVAEVPGIMPDEAYHNRATPGGYTKGMALNSAIGQGDDNVTPLQLAMAYAAIANGGQVYQPQLVRRVEAPDGNVLQEFQPKLVRQIPLSAEQLKALHEGLFAVVNEPGGTAYSKRLKDVHVSGKTGTAQVAKLGEVRLKLEQMDYFQRDHAWFAAFAPSEAPEIAVVVLNEHGGHGGSDAAPTAMAVFKRYFELKNEAPTSARLPVEPLDIKIVRPDLPDKPVDVPDPVKKPGDQTALTQDSSSLARTAPDAPLQPSPE